VENHALRVALLVVATASFAPAAAAQYGHGPDHHRHDHHFPHDEELGHGGQGPHAEHPHFTHPIVTESPLPEKQVRFNAVFAQEEGAEALELEASVEFALTPNVGVEVAVPYTFVNPDEGGAEDGLDNMEVALKFADYRFGQRGVVLGAGVELGLPTGDAGRGIGDDRVIEVEPYAAVAFRRGDFEAVGVLRFGIPLNERSSEADDVDLEIAADGSVLYHLSPRFAVLLELNGATVAAGDANGESILMLSPGVNFAPLEETGLRIGIGVGVPLTEDEEVDWEGRLMAILHF